MKDLAIALEDRPGALAEMGEALGRAGVSIEGGGVWNGAAHFLFADGAAARAALDGAGIRVVAERDVLIQKLRQGEPGQLGKLARRMAAVAQWRVLLELRVRAIAGADRPRVRAPAGTRDSRAAMSRWVHRPLERQPRGT